jgi:hypothetical protein
MSVFEAGNQMCSLGAFDPLGKANECRRGRFALEQKACAALWHALRTENQFGAGDFSRGPPLLCSPAFSGA